MGIQLLLIDPQTGILPPASSEISTNPMRMLDALIFSSACASGVGFVLTLAVGIALGGPPPWTAAALAFSGTFVIYNIDRLRDLERDRQTHPRRSHFVQDNRDRLRALCGVALATAAFSAWALGPAAWLLCALVVVPGLFHRRLKRSVVGKALYVAAAWTLVVVGLAAIEIAGQAEVAALTGAGAPLHWQWAALAVGGPVFANLIASNLFELEQGALAVSRRQGLWGAALLTMVGGSAALVGPIGFASLAWIALVEGASLAFHRPGEGYLAVLDASLLLGGALAVVLA